MTDGIDIQGLPRSLHELLILAVLEDGARHGYQIALEIEERSGGSFTFNHGTLYPILHHLEKEGLIHGTWTAGEGRRKRKEYAPSPRGRALLRERVREWRTLGERLEFFLRRTAEEPARARAAADRP